MTATLRIEQTQSSASSREIPGMVAWTTATTTMHASRIIGLFDDEEQNLREEMRLVPGAGASAFLAFEQMLDRLP